MQRRPNLRLALAAAAFAASAAHAQVVIDTPSAMAGGITPGDTPGFPVTLSVPGSYKLTGNLVVPGGKAVHISGQNVRLDLNGFTIGSSNRCDLLGANTAGNTCNAKPSSDPLVLVEAPFARIHDGVVEGGDGNGITIASAPSAVGGSLIEDVQVMNNLGLGIESADDGTILRNVLVSFNGDTGIQLARESVLENVRSSRNNAGGIATGANTVASQVIATFNIQTGASIDSGTVTRLEASNNGADGFLGSAAVSFSHANANGSAGFRYASMVTQSSASFNATSGYVAPATGGCYANFSGYFNTVSPISAGTGFVGTVAVCP